MASAKRKLDRNSAFPTNFSILFGASGITQEALANALGVSRPTISCWLAGSAVPDILSLTKIAKYFNVSADYLLGLSNTKSADASLRAAATYTGLSERAVQSLHDGLCNTTCTLESVPERETNLNKERAPGKAPAAASDLIENDNFSNIIIRLERVAKAAYWERFLSILYSTYCDDDSENDTEIFHFSKDVDQNFIVNCVCHMLQAQEDDYLEKELRDTPQKDDDELMNLITDFLYGFQNESELNQFHAAKAFTDYISMLIARSVEAAEAYFRK